jgi:hypothetical protein
MTTVITLSDNVAERELAAQWAGIDVEQAAREAMADYIRQSSRKKIDRETQAFEKMHAELLLQYAGQYVAIHQGQVVAHAADLRSLHAEVFTRFGQTPILHRFVTEEPEQDIRTHGLRYGYRCNVCPCWLVGDDQSDEILIGRDVLNKLWLARDGRAQEVDIREARPFRIGR